jgi:anaerobic magnesium-protoporphyrin IX monomethyl ester cyclase
MKQMKVVLATLNAKYIHTSLALRYLKAYAAPHFAMDSIVIREYTIKDPVMNVVSDLYAIEADVVGFSCYIWNIEETITIVEMLRQVRPDIRIFLGGPEVSYDTDYWMARIPAADAIVFGEGEATVLELLQCWQDGSAIDHVQGIWYRPELPEGKSGIRQNAARAKLVLDTIPSPHRFVEDLPTLANRVIYFETSRGCPFRCAFCLSSIESGVRYFSLERVKSDLKYLIDHGARTIKFVDRTFNINREYALEVFQFLIDHHNGCIFQFEITADIMRPELIEFLAEHAPAGTFRFEIGVQSTNDETNLLIDRKQNWSKLTRTVNLVKASGKIDQHLDLIAGLPEEDYSRFKQTFNDVFALRPEELQLGFLKMLRGTGLRRQADRWGYVYQQNAPYEMLGNGRMSFADIIRIKRTEDVLEKYWNAHRTDHSVGFLVRDVFDSPFDFFQAFGDFWEHKGWPRIGHQLDDLFRRLTVFVKEAEDTLAADIHLKQSLRSAWPIVEGLMKLDFFLQHRHRPRAVWWQPSWDEVAYKGWLQWLGEATRANEGGTIGEIATFDPRNRHKHLMLERLPFDPQVWLAGNGMVNGDYLLIAWYDPAGEQAVQFAAVSIERASLSQSRQ